MDRNNWDLGLRVVQIEDEAVLGRELTAPRRRVLQYGQLLVVLTAFGTGSSAWSQQASTFAGATTVAPEVSGSPLPLDPSVPSQPVKGSIHGVVMDRDGTVYEGTRIKLEQVAPSTPYVREATSDADGRFNFADVPAGAFNLTISSNGFVPQVVTGSLKSGESHEVRAIVLLVNTAASEVRVSASQVEIAQAQVKEEEQQRVLGMIPNFYVVYAPNAPPLNARQKLSLAWKTSIDPLTILSAGALAGMQQADNAFSGYGQGSQGYAKRFAADYADSFMGAMLGGAVFPALLRQDPRYFYKGTGTTHARFFYAVANAVVCKGDNGHWQPNYSGIAGGLAAGGISNLYYPASSRDGVTLSLENALIGVGTGAVQNLFQEFVIRKLTPKLPGYAAKP